MLVMIIQLMLNLCTFCFVYILVLHLGLVVKGLLLDRGFRCLLIGQLIGWIFWLQHLNNLRPMSHTARTYEPPWAPPILQGYNMGRNHIIKVNKSYSYVWIWRVVTCTIEMLLNSSLFADEHALFHHFLQLTFTMERIIGRVFVGCGVISGSTTNDGFTMMRSMLCSLAARYALFSASVLA